MSTGSECQNTCVHHTRNDINKRVRCTVFTRTCGPRYFLFLCVHATTNKQCGKQNVMLGSCATVVLHFILNRWRAGWILKDSV